MHSDELLVRLGVIEVDFKLFPIGGCQLLTFCSHFSL